MPQIRKCTNGDFEQVTSLLVQVWPKKVQNLSKLRGVYERALGVTNQRYICAFESGSIVGFCSLSIKNSLWEGATLAAIDEFVVDENANLQTVGTELLDHMIDFARKAGCSRLDFETAFHRTDDQTFVERQGFEQRAYIYTMKL